MLRKIIHEFSIYRERGGGLAFYFILNVKVTLASCMYILCVCVLIVFERYLSTILGMNQEMGGTTIFSNRCFLPQIYLKTFRKQPKRYLNLSLSTCDIDIGKKSRFILLPFFFFYCLEKGFKKFIH